MNPLRSVAPALLAGTLLLVACPGGDEYEFPVEVEVKAKGGGGVAGAVLTMGPADGDRVEIGRTDGEGRFVGVYKGESGQEAVLEITPPADYKLGEDGGQFKVTLGTTETEDGVAPQTLAFQATLLPTSLEYVVLVTSPGKFRPIWVGEERVTRTSGRGAAAVHIRGKPGDEVTIKVEPRTREKQLGKTFTLTDGDRILQLSKADVMEESSADKQGRSDRPGRRTAGRGGGGGGDEGDEPIADDFPVNNPGNAVDRALGMGSDDGGAPSKDDKAAAKSAAKSAKAAAKAAKAASKAAAASAKKVARVMKKYPGAQETVDAAAGAAAAKEASAKAGDAAKAARVASKAADLAGAEDALRDAEDGQRTAEEEAARVAMLVDDAKRSLSERSEELELEAREREARLGEDRERWMADTQAAVDGALAAAAEAKGVAADAKRLSKKAKTKKKAAAKAAKRAAKAYKKADKAAKKIKKLPGKAKKAKVGAGDAIIAKAQDGQQAAEDALSDARAALDDVQKAVDAEDSGGAPIGDTGVGMVASNETAGDIIDSVIDGGKRDKKRKKKDKRKKDKADTGGGDDEGAVECTLDAVEEGLENDRMPSALLKSCAKLKGGTDRPKICLGIAKHWFKKKKWKKQAKALECATQSGEFKYDPSVLYGLIKTYLKIGKYKKAQGPFDRFLQQKDRLPAAQRKKKVCEIYSLFAQTKEQIFYKEQEEDPEADNLPFLEKAIDYWSRYQSYCGSDPKSKKAVNSLKKMKDELIQ